MTKKQLLRQQSRCLEYSYKMFGALEVLSQLASTVLGYEVKADMCNGGEIEFRRLDEFNYVDCNSTIRMEDVLKKLNDSNEKP